VQLSTAITIPSKESAGEPVDKAHQDMPTLCTRPTVTEKGGWGIHAKQG